MLVASGAAIDPAARAREWADDMKQKPSVDVVDLLAAILRGAPALPGAACVGRAELFDGTDPASTETAIALCRYRCPAWPGRM